MKKISFFNEKNYMWKESYSLGIKEIDEEHKNLFNYAFKIINKKNDDKNEIKEVLKILYNYTIKHFKNEESIMNENNYSKSKQHMLLHNKFKKELRKIIISNLEIKEIKEKLKVFIEYLIKHILIDDKRLQYYLENDEVLRKDFKWKNEYKIDNKEIDNEHKELFREVESMLKDNNIKSKLRKLKKFYSSMEEHFNHEIEIMESHKFKELEEHKNEHEIMLKNINNLFQNFSINKDINKIEIELIKIMNIYFVNHIIFEDFKYVSFINSRNVKNDNVLEI